MVPELFIGTGGTALVIRMMGICWGAGLDEEDAENRLGLPILFRPETPFSSDIATIM
jgi:hypothetical protein